MTAWSIHTDITYAQTDLNFLLQPRKTITAQLNHLLSSCKTTGQDLSLDYMHVGGGAIDDDDDDDTTMITKTIKTTGSNSWHIDGWYKYVV